MGDTNEDISPFTSEKEVKDALESSLDAVDRPGIATTLRRWNHSLYETERVPNYLVYVLDYRYEDSQLSLDRLKGKERDVVNAIAAALPGADFVCYLCNLVKHRRGDCVGDHDYGGRDWERDEEYHSDNSEGVEDEGSEGEKYHFIEEVLEESLELTYVGTINGELVTKGVELDEHSDMTQEDMFELCSRDPHKEDYEGSTIYGGATAASWYYDSALLLVPRKFTTELLEGTLPNFCGTDILVYRIGVESSQLAANNPNRSNSILNLTQLCEHVIEEAKRKKLGWAFTDKAFEAVMKATIAINRLDMLLDVTVRFKNPLNDDCLKALAEAVGVWGVPPLQACLDNAMGGYAKSASGCLHAINIIASGQRMWSVTVQADFVSWKRQVVERIAIGMVQKNDAMGIMSIASASNEAKWLLPRLSAQLKPLAGNIAFVLVFGTELLGAVQAGQLDLDSSTTAYAELVSTALSKLKLPGGGLLAPSSARIHALMAKEYRQSSDKANKVEAELIGLLKILLELKMHVQVGSLLRVVVEQSARIDVNGFDSILIPYLHDVVNTMKAKAIPLDSVDYRSLFIGVLGNYLSRFVKQEPPKPRKFVSKRGCGCADCRELDEFLLKRDKKSKHFSVKQQRREHIQSRLCEKDGSQAAEFGVEVTAQGSPYPLKITKINGEVEHYQWCERVKQAKKLLTTAIAKPDELKVLLGPAYEDIVRLRKVTSKPETGGPESLIERLLQLGDPESTAREWLRMCYEADPPSAVPQVSILHEYQGTFAAFQSTYPLLEGKRLLVTIVTSTFPGTALAKDGEKYVVRGLRARVPLADVSNSSVPVADGSSFGVRGTSGQTLRATPTASDGAVRPVAVDVMTDRGSTSFSASQTPLPPPGAVDTGVRARTPLAPVAGSVVNSIASSLEKPTTPATGKRKSEGPDPNERDAKRPTVIDLSDSP